MASMSGCPILGDPDLNNIKPMKCQQTANHRMPVKKSEEHRLNGVAKNVLEGSSADVWINSLRSFP